MNEKYKEKSKNYKFRELCQDTTAMATTRTADKQLSH